MIKFSGLKFLEDRTTQEPRLTTPTVISCYVLERDGVSLDYRRDKFPVPGMSPTEGVATPSVPACGVPTTGVTERRKFTRSVTPHG